MFFLSSMQYLLDYIPWDLKDSKGNPIQRQPFDVKGAAKMWKSYVRDSENLLTAKQVISFF